MQLSRRLLLRGSVALAALWAMPRALLAGTWPGKAFASSAASEAMTELFGTDQTRKSRKTARSCQLRSKRPWRMCNP